MSDSTPSVAPEPRQVEESQQATPAEQSQQAQADSAPLPAPEARIEELEKALAEARAKAQEHYDTFLRAKAEADNTRRRAAEDVSKAHKFGVEKLAEALLAVKDSLDAALVVENTSIESFKTGVELTSRQLDSVLEKFSIKEINPMGDKFDPHKHQAITTMESDKEPNTVVMVMQKGFMLHDRVLRPALVAVSKKKSAEG